MNISSGGIESGGVGCSYMYEHAMAKAEPEIQIKITLQYLYDLIYLQINFRNLNKENFMSHVSFDINLILLSFSQENI